MPRKTRKQQFAALEDESIRAQIPSKILPLIEQLVFERSVEVNAALTLRMKLLEIEVREVERRLEKVAPRQVLYDPSDYWQRKNWDESEGESPDDASDDAWTDPDEDRDDEIPF